MRSRGDVDYVGESGRGEAEVTFTGLFPYFGYAAQERPLLWGAAGVAPAA